MVGWINYLFMFLLACIVDVARPAALNLPTRCQDCAQQCTGLRQDHATICFALDLPVVLHRLSQNLVAETLSFSLLFSVLLLPQPWCVWPYPVTYGSFLWITVLSLFSSSQASRMLCNLLQLPLRYFNFFQNSGILYWQAASRGSPRGRPVMSWKTLLL